MERMPDGVITVFLADDNLIVRGGRPGAAGPRARPRGGRRGRRLPRADRRRRGHQPQVVVTDIRMPPTFQREGIDAAKEIRKRHPGTGIVILSQYDDPEYAIVAARRGRRRLRLPAQGPPGRGRPARRRHPRGRHRRHAARPGDRRRARPPGAAGDDDLSAGRRGAADLHRRGQADQGHRRRPPDDPRGGRPTPSSSCSSTWPRARRPAPTSALRRLRMLHQAIVDREEQGETLSRLLPGGLAEKLRSEGKHIGETEELEVTVLMSDIRGYSTIAERTTPTHLAAQLNEHRAAMNDAILGVGGTVMQFVGDAVMAVFGAPFPQADHADRALEAALAMHRSQHALNQAWEGTEREAFLLGIGLSTGEAAAALLGSEERLEYTLVGDTVNLAQRLQEMARPAGRRSSARPPGRALTDARPATANPPELVKGRATPVTTYRIERETWSQP